MIDQKNRRFVMIGLLTILILTVLLLVFAYRTDAHVLEMVKATKPIFILILFSIGLSYNLTDAFIYRTIYHNKVPSFTLAHAVDLTYLGVFGNIATLAAGTIPIQSYYLSKKGLMAGCSVGLVTVQYALYKFSVLLYACVMLCLQWKWIFKISPILSNLLIISFLMCIVIIAVLIALCTWNKVRFAVFRIIEKLPEHGKWIQLKVNWHNNIEALYHETHALFKDKPKFIKIIVLNFLKLFILYGIPFICMKIIGNDAYTFFQTQVLSSLMLLISNAIPNLAGMGAAEFSFLLLFSENLGTDSMAVLILYRLSTYYFPFILSVFILLFIQQKLSRIAHIASS